MRRDAQRAAAGVGGFAVLAAAITTAIIVVAGAEPAAASGLAHFESCEAMRTWVDDVRGEIDMQTEEGAAMPDVAAAPSAANESGAATSATPEGSAGRSAAATGSSGDAASDTGVTNTVVEGVDEIDIVELLPDDRALVARNGTLSLVDLDRLAVLDSVRGLSPDARVSVDRDVAWVAGSSRDGTGVTITRLHLGAATLSEEDTWTAPGRLVDARRTGDRLHVLAVDESFGPGSLPFEGGPVPCDQVWRPEAGADTPAATLLVTLPAEGILRPIATAQVVGSGAGFLVTETSAYVTTQIWRGTVSTGVHRFDLDTLSPSGSGTVPGMIPGPFGLSEHDGHLRVATNAQPQFGARTGLVEGRPDDARSDAAVSAPPSDRSALAEVFVLDLEGALEIVGRTGRFGHDGETIHGIRFVGDTAYVVTFLQTDPFWVLDLSVPTSPKTVGELQIPGFSGYLHPVDDTHVVGFGPDGAGRTAARLFDVSERTAPTVVGELVLGDDSPVTQDHHAYLGLSRGSFAVPVNDQPTYTTYRCADGPGPGPARVAESSIQASRICQPMPEGGSSGVAVLAVRNGRLVLTDERTFVSGGTFTAERVLPASGDRWILVGHDRLVDPDGGELVLSN